MELTREDELAMAVEDALGLLNGLLWDGYIEDGAPYGTGQEGFERWKRELHAE